MERSNPTAGSPLVSSLSLAPTGKGFLFVVSCKEEQRRPESRRWSPSCGTSKVRDGKQRQKSLAGQTPGRGCFGNESGMWEKAIVRWGGQPEADSAEVHEFMLWGHWFAGAPSKTLGRAKWYVDIIIYVFENFAKARCFNHSSLWFSVSFPPSPPSPLPPVGGVRAKFLKYI